MTVTITPLPTSERANTAHHRKGGFLNPWASFHMNNATDTAKMFSRTSSNLGAKAGTLEITERIPVRQPTWGAGADPAAIKATWLGHACFLLEMPHDPATHGERGVRVLFDPVFSNRCSPVQFMGPVRYTKPPCDIYEIPQVDIIVISNNHYDHLDTNTINALFRRSSIKPHIFAPLGNEKYFASLNSIPKTHSHCFDWWQGARIDTTHGSIDLHCTPSQHITGRGFADKFKALWASWAIVGVGAHGKKVWFGGDTGYRSVCGGQDEDQVPVCPAFAEIGEAFGHFDFAMIPIGAYEPREVRSPIHCAPQDSVRVFKDIRARRAIGMHWGTWVLSAENIFEPPQRLKREAAKLGISPEEFNVSDIGETVVIESSSIDLVVDWVGSVARRVTKRYHDVVDHLAADNQSPRARRLSERSNRSYQDQLPEAPPSRSPTPNRNRQSAW